MPVRERLTGEAAVEKITALLGSLASGVGLNYRHVAVFCEPQHVVEVMRLLRDGEGVQCRFFSFLSAVDYSEFKDWDKPHTLEVLIQVCSPDHATEVTVHVPLDAANPSCPSISDVYKGALWHERETHEMFGIDFPGHPRLVRLYLPEDFEGHPLLKAFKLPTRAAVKPWPGAKDPEEAAAGGR